MRVMLMSISLVGALLLPGCSPKRVVLPRGSYALVMSDAVVSVCSGGTCQNKPAASVGSGIIVASNGGASWAITAAHVCKPAGTSIVAATISIAAYSGDVYPAVIAGMLEPEDVCVLLIQGVSLPPVKLAARGPVQGDKSYTLASPLSLFDREMVIQLDGYYCGKKRGVSVQGASGPHVFPVLDAYSIPSTVGSSGGGVFNEDGRLIGMSILARPTFENFTLSVPYPTIVQVVQAVVEASGGES